MLLKQKDSRALVLDETFSRDLIDVKIESESRSIITTTIKNTTPIPAGAEVSKYDEESRKDGDRFKYVLEKNQAGWRLAEIWKWQSYSSRWEKRHPGDGTPHVHSLTMDGY